MEISKLDEIEGLLIKDIESKAFKCTQNLTEDIPFGEEEKNGKYVVGYLDGLSDLCNTLKKEIHELADKVGEM